MRHVTEQGLNLIKRFEGFSHTIYICPAGYPTIGYGHVVLTHERELFARGITADEGTTSLTLRRHPLALLRPKLARMNLRSAMELSDTPPSGWCGPPAS